MKKKIALVTGCDQNYFFFLKNLILSLKKNKCFEKIDLCILNINFTDDQLFFLKKFSSNIKKAKWDIKFNFKAADWKKLLVCRPFIKNYFTGYNLYIWLDADTFVQNNKFIDIFFNTGKKNKISICTENDFNYLINSTKNEFKNIFLNIFKINGWTYKNNKKFLSKKFANFQLNKPLFNAGVFAIPSDSIIWDLWKKKFIEIIKNADDQYALNMDQASLNYCIYNNLELVNIFDAKYNWLIKNRIPLFCNKNKKFYTNMLPNKEISILHFTGIDIKKKIIFKSLTNKKYKLKLI